MSDLDTLLSLLSDAQCTLEEAEESGDLEERFEAAQEVAELEKQIEIARLKENE